MFERQRKSAPKIVVALSRWIICLLCGLAPFVFSGSQQEADVSANNMRTAKNARIFR